MAVRKLEQVIGNSKEYTSNIALMNKNKEAWATVNALFNTVMFITRRDRQTISAVQECVYTYSGNPMEIIFIANALRYTAENAGINGAARKIASVVLKSQHRADRKTSIGLKTELKEYLSRSKEPIIIVHMIKQSYPELIEKNKEEIKLVFDEICIRKSDAIKKMALEIMSNKRK